MFGGPLARCLGPSQTEYVMKEIHEGHCGNHTGGRSLVKPITRAGYYWPKVEEEAKSFVAKCDKCQRYGNNMHRPAELLHPVIAPWPFMKWGMDSVGPLPQAKGKTGGIKGQLADVLLGVLWAYRTTAKTTTGEMPFSLVYGAEALIPVEIGEPSMRYNQATEAWNEEEMRVNLDLLEEMRETALIRMATQKQVIECYYNPKAHLRYFKNRDYVLKKVFQSTRAANA
ncbi:uncharacterized protein [Nicotiana sylvestris]|uniref:uncharacterized protein n=1 Tax=Nicotiana sylvestris TaxID=4096 RepID=UPI00388C93DE